MGKTKIIGLSIATFIVCFALGFGMTKFIGNQPSDEELVESGTPYDSQSNAKGNSNNIANSSQKAKSEQPTSTTETNLANKIAKMNAENAKKEAELAKVKTAKETNDKPQAGAKTANGPTNSELTAIINGNSKDYPRNISIRYTNLAEDEEAQTSISNVRSYIRTGIWKSVTVVGSTCDSKGKVTSITLQINR